MKATKLRLGEQLARPDDFYEELIEMHRDLTPEQSRLANAKLILLLSNHIGDREILSEAIRIARESIRKASMSK